MEAQWWRRCHRRVTVAPCRLPAVSCCHLLLHLLSLGEVGGGLRSFQLSRVGRQSPVAAVSRPGGDGECSEGQRHCHTLSTGRQRVAAGNQCE